MPTITLIKLLNTVLI